MRIFVALPLPEEAIHALEHLQEALDLGRPVAAENLHVTLAFLGDQDLPTATAVDAELSEITAPALTLDLSGLDVVSSRQPRLVHAAVSPDPALKALREKVRVAARRAGVDLPRERFRPHVTLARFPRDLPRHRLDRLGRFLEGHGDFRLPGLEITQFVLYRSHLSNEGADYEPLAEYPLEQG